MPNYKTALLLILVFPIEIHLIKMQFKTILNIVLARGFVQLVTRFSMHQTQALVTMVTGGGGPLVTDNCCQSIHELKVVM